MSSHMQILPKILGLYLLCFTRQPLLRVNLNMRIEASTDTLKTHATNIHSIMSAMAMEFQQSNHRIHNIMQSLAATSPDPINTNVARLPPAPSTAMDTNIDNHLAPPGFPSTHYGASPSSLHKGQHQSYD
jgi:hypothetical protein